MATRRPLAFPGQGPFGSQPGPGLPWSGGPQDLHSIPSARAWRATSAPSGVPLVHVWNAQQYSKISELLVPIAAGVSTLILDQPPGARNLLLIRNLSTTDSLYISFGRAASLQSIIKLPPDTASTVSEFMQDAGVSQDDIYAFCPTATTVAVGHSTLALPNLMTPEGL